MTALNFGTNIILENDRVQLRPLTMDDTRNLLPYSMNEPDLWQYSLMPGNGEGNLYKYISSAVEKRKSNDSYPFIVFDKKANKYAGSTRFYDYNKTHNTVQLGFTWYGKEFWGTGLNKNCKYLMLEYAFDQLGLQRVEFRADANNSRSVSAMKSLGCIEEGILRSNCQGRNERRDSIILSILKDEWAGSVKDSLKARI